MPSTLIHFIPSPFSRSLCSRLVSVAHFGTNKHLEVSRTDLGTMQAPTAGIPGPQCLGAVGLIPLCTAIAAVVLRYAFRPLWRRRPIWLRKFAAEEEDLVSQNDEEVAQSSPSQAARAYSSWTLALLVLTGAAGVFGSAITAVWPATSQMSLAPVIPAVSRNPRPLSNVSNGPYSSYPSVSSW